MKCQILVYILPILILTSCLFSGCPTIEISKEDKEWSIPFQKYHELTFENQYGESHIFKGQKLDSNCTPCNKFELGPNQFEVLKATYSSNKVLKTPSGEDQTIYLSIDASEKMKSKSIKYLTVYDFRLAFFEIDTNFILDTIFCPAFNKNMVAYYFNTSNWYNENRTDVNVKSIHYSKDYGLLQYISEEDTFKLIKVK